MATLSLTPPNPIRLLTFTHHGHLNLLLRAPSAFCGKYGSPSTRTPHVKHISAAKLPSSPPRSPPGELYQPFRPPPSPLPQQFRSLDLADRIEVLRNRLGLWYEYAALVPSLSCDGFTPPSIEELTGLTGVEQNCLLVAALVRDSLVSSNFDADLLAYFDVGGAELLYELRLLNATQRVAAARHLVQDRLDPKAAQELARAIKDFPRRRGEQGWESFSGESPADCLAYTYFRLSKEALADDDRRAALVRALEGAETDRARKRIEEELEKKGGEGSGVDGDGVASYRVSVVRMRYGEVAESTSVVVLPVCEAGDGKEGVAAAPGCRAGGEFRVVTADKGWRRWVVLPGWAPMAGIGDGGGVAVAFPDARVLPWRTNKWEKEEAVLVVADRRRKEVAEGDDFYLVSRVGGGAGGGLAVERGSKLLELEVKVALGTVVLVVRPPKDEVDNLIPDEEWD